MHGSTTMRHVNEFERIIREMQSMEECTESNAVDNPSEILIQSPSPDYMGFFLESSKWFLKIGKNSWASNLKAFLCVLTACCLVGAILHKSCISLVWIFHKRQKQGQITDRSQIVVTSDTRPGLRQHRAKSQPNLKQSLADQLNKCQPIDSDDENDEDEIRKQRCYYSYSPSSDWDYQTEEDRFLRLWPTQSKLRLKYSKLILPPSCRRIESLTSTTPSSSKHLKSTRKTNLSDEDNPVKRLQNYVRQLLAFVRSMLMYDYTGAGRILTYWLEAWERIREYRQKSFRGSPPDDKDVDVTVLVTETQDYKQRHKGAAAKDIRKDMNSKTVREVCNSLSSWTTEKTDEKTISSTFQEEKKEMTEDSLDFGTETFPDRIPRVLPLPNTYDPCDVHSVTDMCKVEPEDSFRSVIHSNDVRNESYSVPNTNISHDAPPDRENVSEVHPETDCMKEQKIIGPLHLQSVVATLENDGEQLTSARDHSVGVAVHGQRMNSSHMALRRWISDKQRNDPTQQSLPHFFDTADSQESMRQQDLDVLIPDKNGYVLSEHLLPDPRNDTPLLVFVNSRSGPQQGHILIAQLRRLLNPIQVWDLADGGPESILESFSVFTRLRILVCGGDGTVAWIISALEKRDARVNKHEYPTNRSRSGDNNVQGVHQDAEVETGNANKSSEFKRKPHRRWPPIAILPLGTGNDLARMHGWGGGYNNESLITILEQISESYASLLDVWEVTISDTKNKKIQTKNFFNYLGVGADAQAALQVHYLRESRPDWFFSRLVNKAMYGLFGAEDIIKASSVNTRKNIKLIADGVEIPLPPDSQGIIILNIDAYAGGVPLWSHAIKQVAHSSSDPLLNIVRPRRRRSLTEFDSIESRNTSSFVQTKGRNRNLTDSSDELLDSLSFEERYASVTACDLPASCQDGILDIVSIRGAFHLGQIKVGLSNAHRLCQCREVTILIKNTVAVQVDGEPWRQPACNLTIKRKQEQAVMLHRSADDGGVEMEMSKLLDWAEERKMIDSQVHMILMKEFSRRIESKNRQRRVREKDGNIMSTLKKAISSGGMSNSLSNIPSSQVQWPVAGLSF